MIKQLYVLRSFSVVGLLLTTITVNLQAAQCKIETPISKTELEYALQEIIDLQLIDTPTAKALKKKKIEDLQALIKLEKDK